MQNTHTSAAVKQSIFFRSIQARVAAAAAAFSQTTDRIWIKKFREKFGRKTELENIPNNRKDWRLQRKEDRAEENGLMGMKNQF